MQESTALLTNKQLFNLKSFLELLVFFVMKNLICHKQFNVANFVLEGSLKIQIYKTRSSIIKKLKECILKLGSHPEINNEI